MKVELRYFKTSGKWYEEGTYETESKPLFMIWQDVRRMADEGRLPGLTNGVHDYFILVDVPEHEHRHPHVVFPSHMRVVADD